MNKMSDDLISRKALLKQFIVSDSGRRIPEYDIDNFPITLSIKDVKDIIRKAPTVFDKEKVIKELREELNLSDAEKERCARENPLQFDSAKGYANGIANAIEIVEKGGIE